MRNNLWIVNLAEQIRDKTDKHKEEAIKIWPTLDNKVGTSTLFSPESWLELKNRRESDKQHNPFLTQDLYENYIQTYAYKIMQKYEVIIETRLQEAIREANGFFASNVINRFRSGMYNINTQLERVNFLKKEKERLQNEIDEYNHASGIFKFFRGGQELHKLMEAQERIKIP